MTYSDLSNTDAGSYKVTVSLKDTDNYTFTGNKDSVELNWSISKKDISSSVITLTNSLTYNGSEQTQTATASLTGFDITYDVSNNKATDAGTYSLTITGTGNYTGTASKEFNIAKKNISSAVITLTNTLTYTGSEQTQLISATLDGSSFTYDVSDNKQTNAGTYTLTITGNGNYTGTASKEYTVGKKEVSKPTVSGSYTYDGTEMTVNLTGFDSSIMTISGNKGTNAKDYTAVVTLDSNHTFSNNKSSVDLSWSIGKQDISNADVTLDNTLDFNGLEQSEEVTVTLNGKSVKYVVTGNTATNVGTYILTITGIDNYTGTITIEYKVN